MRHPLILVALVAALAIPAAPALSQSGNGWNWSKAALVAVSQALQSESSW